MKKLKAFLFTFILVMAAGGGIILYVANNEKTATGSSYADSQQMIVSENELVNGDDEPVISYNKVELQQLERPSDEYRTRYITPSNNREVTISFAGDVLFDPTYSVFIAYKERGYDLNQCFDEDVLSAMRGADIMMLNNEFPYSDRGEKLKDKQYTFRANPESVSILDELGVDIVALANNHAYDYGEEALLDTLEVLANDNMPYVGAGENIDEASAPYYFYANDMKIAFVAATQIERTWNPDTKSATEDSAGVFRCYDSKALCETISEAKKDSDFVILYVHWGTESTDVLHHLQVSQAKEYAAAGVDIIIGDHPHVLQSIEYVAGIPVVYSLGNFWFNSKTQDSCMVNLTIDTGSHEIKSLQFVPCKQSNMKVSMLYESEKSRVINYMNSISGTSHIDENGFVTAK